jgi:hypothetical protein
MSFHACAKAPPVPPPAGRESIEPSAAMSGPPVPGAEDGDGEEPVDSEVAEPWDEGSDAEGPETAPPGPDPNGDDVVDRLGRPACDAEPWAPDDGIDEGGAETDPPVLAPDVPLPPGPVDEPPDPDRDPDPDPDPDEVPLPWPADPPSDGRWFVTPAVAPESETELVLVDVDVADMPGVGQWEPARELLTPPVPGMDPLCRVAGRDRLRSPLRPLAPVPVREAVEDVDVDGRGPKNEEPVDDPALGVDVDELVLPFPPAKL